MAKSSQATIRICESMPTNGMVKFRLSEGVFWFSVDAQTLYVRNVRLRTDYLFGSSVGPVLEFFKEKHSLAELDEYLKSSFQCCDIQAMLREMRRFVQKLIMEGILKGDADGIRADSTRVIESAQSAFLGEKKIWSAGLELTYRCNEHCRHCYVGNETLQANELSSKEWYDVLDQLRLLGCVNVLITGGEPTLRNDFIEICSYAVAKGFLVDVFTNALNIDDDVFEALCRLSLNSISFSLYGIKDAHDKITGVKGSYDRSLFNILKFKAAGFDVYVKASVFRGMIGSYFELKHVCEMLSIPVVPSPIIIPSQCGEDRGELVITDEDYRELLRGMQSDCPEATCSVKRKSIDSPLCHAGLTTICVDPYGNVFPCNSYRKLCGNVRSDRIEDIWNDSPVLKSVRGKSFRDLSKRCDGCVDFDFCTVCAGVTYPLFGEVRRCDYLCSQAHVRHEIFGRKGGENDETV